MMSETTKIKLAVFASGNGSNAEQIMQYFSNHDRVEVSLILSNKSDAYVVQRALKHRVPCFVFSRKSLNEGSVVDKALADNKIDFIVLAGFMLLMPKRIIDRYPKAIVNIHPALLPKYGGKGMYGHHVHEAVVQNKEEITGITIHWVNERYDEGAIIFQASCTLGPKDTAAEVADKVHRLEHAHYPKVIEGILAKKDS
jgi:phosphoribosylglycinamide formyltransferase-1